MKSHYRLDLKGKRFGRWLVIEKYSCDRHGSRWLCLCDCGIRKTIAGNELTRNASRSCGCFAKTESSRRAYCHGHAASTNGKQESLTYRSWHSMLSRCGKRKWYEAVSVCEHWKSFANFLADMGERPSRLHTIDRINSTGIYEPGNCRWATIKQQNRNKRVNRLLSYDGLTLTVAEWAEKQSLPAAALYHRLRNGWSVERILTQPLQEKRRARTAC